MKVLVFGRNGWLAHKFADAFDGEVSQADVTSVQQVTDAIYSAAPDVVINAAAKVGSPNIDWCAKNSVNMRMTRYVNSISPALIQGCCRLTGARLVHLSSGCLWEFGENLTEEEPPEPPSFYSRTKVDGESMLEGSKDAIILRIRMPFDDSDSHRSIINKLARYKKVISLPNSLTYIPDLIGATKHLLHKDASGIFNVVNTGGVTGEQILDLYRRHVDNNHEYELVTMDYLLENGLCTEGRSNCTLSGDKLAATGYQMPPAMQRLEEAMKGIWAMS